MEASTAALLKNLLLSVTHLCVFLAARRVLGDAYLALLSSLSLWLLPQIAWESHRDLTHSVLATSLSAAATCAGVQVWQIGRARHYVMLGLLSGLGALAKPNFLIFALALFTAGLSQREVRGRFADPRMLLTVGVAGVVVLPHLLWLLGHGPLDASQSVQPWAPSSAGPPLGAVAVDLVELVWASLRFIRHATLTRRWGRPADKRSSLASCCIPLALATADERAVASPPADSPPSSASRRPSPPILNGHQKPRWAFFDVTWRANHESQNSLDPCLGNPGLPRQSYPPGLRDPRRWDVRGRVGALRRLDRGERSR